MKIQEVVDRCILDVDRGGRLYIKYLDKKGWPWGIKRFTSSRVDSINFLFGLIYSLQKDPAIDPYKYMSSKVRW